MFARHPIMCSHVHPYVVSGNMGDLFDGELFAGKGMLMCRILTPSGPVAFYTTHVSLCMPIQWTLTSQNSVGLEISESLLNNCYEASSISMPHTKN